MHVIRDYTVTNPFAVVVVCNAENCVYSTAVWYSKIAAIMLLCMQEICNSQFDGIVQRHLIDLSVCRPLESCFHIAWMREISRVTRNISPRRSRLLLNC